MQIVHLDAGYYLHHTYVKGLETAGKQKKYTYLQPCLEQRNTFNPIVYSMDGIPKMKAVASSLSA